VLDHFHIIYRIIKELLGLIFINYLSSSHAELFFRACGSFLFTGIETHGTSPAALIIITSF